MPGPRHLVDLQGVERRGELVDLHHRLLDSRAGFLELGHKPRVIEDPARNLAVPAAKAEHKVERRLLCFFFLTFGPTFGYFKVFFGKL